MKIYELAVEHRKEPLGIDGDDPLFSFLCDGDGTFSVSVFDSTGKKVAEKNITTPENGGFRFGMSFCGRYSWNVAFGNERAESRFETFEKFDAPFITPRDGDLFAPCVFRRFDIDKKPLSARLHVTGLGLYRAFLNGERIGNRYMTPGFNDYGSYLRVGCYDVTELLREGENEIDIFLGDGWYRGEIGLDRARNVYGTRYEVAARLVFEFENGEIGEVKTDGSWYARTSSCVENSVYDGEKHDFTRSDDRVFYCTVTETEHPVCPDFGVPTVEKEILRPILTVSPKDEKILDFGQNFAGFVRFNGRLARGQTLRLSHGEVLQNGCFYNGNLRSAKAAAEYVGDGQARSFEPMFTYFGFRYVLVEGLMNVDPSEFEGVVLSADLRETCRCETDDPGVNALIKNTLWGQRSNFIDVPTDCPQRDERLGWTADAQVFAATACFNMNCYPFYKKYLRDLEDDSTLYYGGDFPMYSPSLRGIPPAGGAVWADCGVILPWKIYEYYGDLVLLGKCYPMMRDYVSVLRKKDREQGNRGLITEGFAFGDWLALDGLSETSMVGATDKGFIMSVYYYNSVCLTAKAADELGRPERKDLATLAGKIRAAVLDEYFSPSGRLALDTQTAYVLSLYYGIYRHKAPVTDAFVTRLRRDGFKLKTGFAGTPLLLPALFDAGLDDDAFRILLNRDYPGWLCEIELGATTVWERWNSLLPNGLVSETGMNSFNHYAYGSVCEAIYSRIAGLRYTEAGWKSALIEPHPHRRLRSAKLEFEAVTGLWKVSWRLDTDRAVFSLRVTVPPGCTAQVSVFGEFIERIADGEYSYELPVPERIVHPFSPDTPNIDIMAHKGAKNVLKECLPQIYAACEKGDRAFLLESVRSCAIAFGIGADDEKFCEYENKLRGVKA